MNRGFVIMAQNTDAVDYVHCAEQLKSSLLRAMPDEQVTIITVDELPYGDVDPTGDWRLSNDWQVYEASPYEYTIKLEADMLVPRRIDHWWTVLKKRDLNICTKIRDYRGNISTDRSYRAIFDKNDLPDCYNAITYFKRSPLAKEFFELVRNIFENWQEWRNLLQYSPDVRATTDVVYGMAAKIIGPELCTLPHFNAMSMVHMKQRINNNRCHYWPDEFVYEISHDTFRINSFTQQYPVHYHIKEFSKVIERELAND